MSTTDHRNTALKLQKVEIDSNDSKTELEAFTPGLGEIPSGVDFEEEIVRLIRFSVIVYSTCLYDLFQKFLKIVYHIPYYETMRSYLMLEDAFRYLYT